MSRTELYIIKKNGSIELYKEYSNSHRGAMILWDNLFKKYIKNEKYKYFFDLIDKEGDKFWRLDIDKRLSRSLRLMLASTFDYMIIEKKNLYKFIEAINIVLESNEFNDLGHWNDYPKDFQDIIQMEDIYGIAWNQTSVNTECWWELRKDKRGKYHSVKHYNFRCCIKRHQELFEYLEYMEKKYWKEEKKGNGK